MLTNLLFPQCAGLRVDRFRRDGATIHLRVSLRRRWAPCPLCQRRSRRRRSQYRRTLADVPCGRNSVILHLRVRRFVCRVRWCRRQVFAEAADAASAPAAAATPPPAAEPAERRARRLARYEAMVALRARGATCRTIARRLDTSERTVQRWLRDGHFPERRRRSERPGQLSWHAAHLQARWAEGCHNAARLHQQLQGRGFSGSYESVAAFVAPGATRATPIGVRSGLVRNRPSDPTCTRSAHRWPAYL